MSGVGTLRNEICKARHVRCPSHAETVAGTVSEQDAGFGAGLHDPERRLGLHAPGRSGCRPAVGTVIPEARTIEHWHGRLLNQGCCGPAQIDTTDIRLPCQDSYVLRHRSTPTRLFQIFRNLLVHSFKWQLSPGNAAIKPQHMGTIA